jgi:O-antigen/teichoic acid export membrane protein
MNRTRIAMAILLISIILGMSLIPLFMEVNAQQTTDELKLYLHTSGGGTLDTIAIAILFLFM